MFATHSLSGSYVFKRNQKKSFMADEKLCTNIFCLPLVYEIVSFPDPPAKEGLVYKVGILGCAESACSENG